LKITSRHALVTVVGNTHASNVIADVNRNDGASGTVTRALDPLKLNAFPNRPDVDHAADPTCPVFPRPEASPALGPDPSSNP
jgi:hypothetical protein